MQYYEKKGTNFNLKLDKLHPLISDTVELAENTESVFYSYNFDFCSNSCFF